MVLVVITGGNGDIGIEACKQLSKTSEITKIVLTCRSKEKATDAIDSLVSTTGKDPSFFGWVALDLTDYKSIVQAAAELPNIDRLCLNAGGLGKCKMHPCGATDGMVINTLGHVVLFEKLVANEKVSKGSRVVFVGSEVSHDIYSFSGLLPHYYGRFGEKDIEWAIGSTYNDLLAKLLPVRAQLGDYKNSKILGQLYFSHMAKVYPDIHFMTISPGGIHGGKDGREPGFANNGFFPLNKAMKHTPFLFKWLGVTHTIEEGTSRLIDGVLVGEESAWDSGSMVMSKKDGLLLGLFFWGAKGEVTDVRPLVPYLKDEELAGKASLVLQQWISKWENM